MTDNLKQLVIDKIKSFNDLKDDDTDVETLLTDKGQFKITVKRGNAEVAVLHSWQDDTFSFDNPNTVDIYFEHKNENVKSVYAIFMTGYELKFFLEFLNECLILTAAFLNNNYSVEKKKKLWKHKYKLVFNTNTTYKIASKI